MKYVKESKKRTHRLTGDDDNGIQSTQPRFSRRSTGDKIPTKDDNRGIKVVEQKSKSNFPIGLMSHEGGKMSDDCICDICIDSYLELYQKIIRLEDILWKWKSYMTMAEKDEINHRIHLSIKARDD